MERLAEIFILVVVLAFFLYGVYYAFRLWMRQNTITFSDITEPFRSISAFKTELKFLLPILFGIFIISAIFGEYRILGISFPAFLVYVLIRAFMNQKAEPPIESPKQFSTEKSSCGHCGAPYNPADYRQDAAEWLCLQCKKPFPKE